ncbi:hypothetical protein [Burkholderia cenocepacia]|uniref:hypothetical protein n=1 Tax=Burkholderia cenocepacia TaxID=95486 RepID=UPI000761B3B2|nr:hypothetical protein [Burkholderia cenocepacia]KWU23389.1 hypothetical protein AS149_36995 [Burkholderia cenocepacia]
MILNKEIEAFWKTRAFLKSAEMSAAGWDSRILDVEAGSGAQVFSYLYDYSTQYVWMCTTPVEVFNAAARFGKSTEEAATGAQTGLSAVLSNVADKKSPPRVEGFSWEEQLALLTAVYAGTTMAWDAADRFPKGGHFIVIHYRSTGAKQGALRPFVANHTQSVLPAASLLAGVQQVIAVDAAKHPEWLEGRVF